MTSAPSALKKRGSTDPRPTMRMAKAAMRQTDAAIGRPLAVISPEQRAELLRAFERGLDVQTACDSAGVGLPTFGRAMVENAVLRAEIKKAQANHVDAALARLRELPAGRWQAAAWELERLYPERFGQGHRPDLSGQVVKVEVTATLCAQMHESWRRFASEVVDVKDVAAASVASEKHNIGYIQSKIGSDASNSGSEGYEVKQGDDRPAELVEPARGPKGGGR